MFRLLKEQKSTKMRRKPASGKLVVVAPAFLMLAGLVACERAQPRQERLPQNISSVHKGYEIASRIRDAVDKDSRLIGVIVDVSLTNGNFRVDGINYGFASNKRNDREFIVKVDNIELLASVFAIYEGVDEEHIKKFTPGALRQVDLESVAVDVTEALAIIHKAGEDDPLGKGNREPAQVSITLEDSGNGPMWMFTYDAWDKGKPLGEWLMAINAKTGELVSSHKDVPVDLKS